MQKIRKILRAVSEKTASLTNQPIITNNTDFIGPGWRQSNKKYWKFSNFTYSSLLKNNIF